MSKKKIVVDKYKCLSCGLCMQVAPDTFMFDEYAKSSVINPAITDEAKEAKRVCPIQAIDIRDEEEITNEEDFVNENVVPINLDEIKYAGASKVEQQLNKELLQTTLNLNYYQDNYDCMKTIEEIRTKIEELKEITNQEETNYNFIKIKDAKSKIEILEWVLNNAQTLDEKLRPFEVSPEEVSKTIERLKEEDKKRKDII